MARRGTSITVNRDVLRWIDKRVKERIFASCNHAFECAGRRLMKQGSQDLDY